MNTIGLIISVVLVCYLAVIMPGTLVASTVEKLVGQIYNNSDIESLNRIAKNISQLMQTSHKASLHLYTLFFSFLFGNLLLIAVNIFYLKKSRPAQINRGRLD
ncbi:hypothetical protein [Candidatus Electrothrix sp.]|uniref:hypothetical protein n=1 Tax=Candidatus Electrothrix sp. TaxID=2170559 RepID=UPI00405749D3